MGEPHLVVDRRTVVTPMQLLAALESADPSLTRESRLTLLSQWALETGRGRSCHCFNLGNVKGRPGGADGHSWTFFRCDERLNGVRVWFDPPDPACCFRAYDSLDEGCADYLGQLRGRFGFAWPAVLAGDPVDFAHRLKVARYYTSTEAQYARNLAALYREFDRTIGDHVAPFDLHATAGVQQALNALGADPPLAVDGLGGPHTWAAVRWFQHDHGLEQDGKVGPATRAELADALASRSSDTDPAPAP